MKTIDRVPLLGTELIENIIQTNLIKIYDEDLKQRDGKTVVTDFNFAKGLKEQPLLMESLEEVTKALLSLFFFVEKNEKLRFSIAPERSIRSLFPFGETSGMTVLNLFSKGVLELTENTEDVVTVSADTLFFDEIGNGEEIIRELMKSVLLFGGETKGVKVQRARKKLVKTDLVLPGMRITYEYRHEYEKSMKESIKLNTDFVFKEPESARERIIRENRESTLDGIRKLMNEIDRESRK